MPIDQEDFLDIHFPKAGLNVVSPFGRQPNVEIGDDHEYARTALIGTNVLGYGALDNRRRGGSRLGLSRSQPLFLNKVNGVTWVVQQIDSVVTVGAASDSNLSGPTSAMVGYYRLEGDLTDSSGKGQDLTADVLPVYTSGATTPTAGKINRGLVGGSGYKHPLTSLTDNALTLSAWFYALSGNGHGAGTGFGKGAEVGNALRIEYTADAAGSGKGKIKVRDRSGVDVLETTFVLNFGTWYHAAMVYTGTHVQLYLNAVLIGSTPYIIPAGWHALSYGINTVGADLTTPIDEVAVYGRPLTAAEITQLYNSGSALDPTGSNVPTSQSGRSVTLVAVSQGVVKYGQLGDANWTTATNNTGETPPLNYNGVIYSAPNNQKLYFADNINYVYFDPATGSLELWTASAGTLPVDSDGNTPRLICTWRGRTVVSGLNKDPQNIFMSAVSNPRDFDYAPLSPTPTQAVALNLSPLGLIGDVVTALIPFNDDILIVGGDHTIYAIRGDPMAGGQIDRISDAIGIAWGMAWCKDSYGNIYFISNRTGVYSLSPGQRPVRISQAIETLLTPVDMGKNIFSMIWDDRFQGFHLFITWADEPMATSHYFWEQRTGAWFKTVFANTNHNPLCCCTFDGNDPDDRLALIGCWDGYVRVIDPDATDDDGTPIASEVWLGPIVTADFDDILCKDLQAVLAEGSGAVNYAVYVGSTAEAASAAGSVVSGTWAAGRNLLSPVRRSGHAIYVSLSSTVQWAMEAVRMRLSTLGKLRRRGR